MKDTPLYEQLLGLSNPWPVSGVEPELKHTRITMHLSRYKGMVRGDPETGCDPTPVHSWVQRQWQLWTPVSAFCAARS